VVKECSKQYDVLGALSYILGGLLSLRGGNIQRTCRQVPTYIPACTITSRIQRAHIYEEGRNVSALDDQGKLISRDVERWGS
jgi:hypothetical protein